MQITMNQKELIEAIEDFVVKQGIQITGRELDTHLTAGRGGNGYTATIDIKPQSEVVDTAEPDTNPETDALTEPEIDEEEKEETKELLFDN